MTKPQRKRCLMEELLARINDMDQSFEELNEQFSGVEQELDAAKAEAEQQRARAEAAEHELAELRQAMAPRAVTMRESLADEAGGAS